MAPLLKVTSAARTAQSVPTVITAQMRVSRSGHSEASPSNASRPHLPVATRSPRPAVPGLSTPRQQPSSTSTRPADEACPPQPLKLARWATAGATSTRPADETCSPPQPLKLARRVTAGAAAGLVLAPLAAAAAETAPDGFFEALLTTIDTLGPLGPVAFVAAVAICECIPMFPTQPFSLASGLLFGTQTGALCMLSGNTIAAFIAFTIARGVGRPLAERILRHEMASTAEGTTAATAAANPVQVKLQEVQAVIEAGSFWQQTLAVFVLRMTPIVPFSVSNYVLGLSPVPLGPYLAGSVAGMSFWATLYASLGGASRALLRRGADPDALLNDLLAKTANLTGEAGVAAAVLGGAAATVWGISALANRTEGGNDESLVARLAAAARSLRQRQLASKE